MVIDENFLLAGNSTSALNGNEASDERLAVRAQLFTTGPHPGGYGIREIYGRLEGFQKSLPMPRWALSPSIPRTRKATRT